MKNSERRASIEINQNEIMTPNEFESLLKHTEVMMDKYAYPGGDLQRLADAPIEEGGEPVKKFLIYLNPSTTGKEQALVF